MCCHNRPFAQRVPDGRSESGSHSPITSICRSVPSNCSACARASSGLVSLCACLMNATTCSYVTTVLRGGVSLYRNSANPSPGRTRTRSVASSYSHVPAQCAAVVRVIWVPVVCDTSAENPRRSVCRTNGLRPRSSAILTADRKCVVSGGGDHDTATLHPWNNDQSGWRECHQIPAQVAHWRARPPFLPIRRDTAPRARQVIGVDVELNY